METGRASKARPKTLLPHRRASAGSACACPTSTTRGTSDGPTTSGATARALFAGPLRLWYIGLVRVTEIYKSIQGETTFAGLPCTLVRFTACNLRCSWCDTPHAFQGGQERSRESIRAEVARLGAPLVLLTGGEPLLQQDLPELASELMGDGFRVMVETGGHMDVSAMPPGCAIILDIKCPGSGESARNLESNWSRLRPGDEVKFVVADEADFRFAGAIVRAGRIPESVEILYSPVHGACEPRALVEWLLASRLRGRVQLQLHKYIWGADAQGV